MHERHPSEDPSTLEELGVDKEALKLPEHDLARLKESLLTEAAKGGAGFLTGSKVIVILALLAMAGAVIYSKDRSENEAPEIARAPMAERTAEIPTIKKENIETATVEPVEQPDPVAMEKPKPIKTKRATKIRPREEPSGKQPFEPSESTLRAQVALYEQGDALLRADDLKRAIATFETYRKTYPGGALWGEASIGLLDAFHRSRQYRAAITLAEELLAVRSLAHRRSEISRIRAEMLALEHRCAEAEKAFAEAKKQDVSLTDEVIARALSACERKGE